MSLIVLAPMFVTMLLICVFAFADLGPMRFLLGLCAGLLCVLGVASQPWIIRLVEIPYQALGLAVLLIGALWVFMQLGKWGGK